MSSSPDQPDYGAKQVTVALQLASFQVANDVRIAERPGATRDRMKVALSALEERLRETAGEFYVRGIRPDLAPMLEGSGLDDRRAFLLEIVAGDPFAPFWFEWTKDRQRERSEAIRRLAWISLDMEVEDAELIDGTWAELVKEENRAAKPPKGLADYMLLGLGAAAVAGLAVVAGPMIAPLMPAAAGLSGAAALSAGLAQLGFGSIAAGGLGMTGGLWMLGLAGGAVGLSGSAVVGALQGAVATPGGAPALRVELLKLLTSASLARRHDWFDGALEPFEKVIQEIDQDVDDQLALERGRNDDGAPRLAELETLRRSVNFAGERLRDLLAQ